LRIYKLRKMRINNLMTEVSKFLEEVGRDRLVVRFGFRSQDISRAVRENKFPSGWFPYIRALCEELELAVPEHLFRWSNVPKRKKETEMDNPPKSDSEAA